MSLWNFGVSEGGHYSKPVPVEDGMGMMALRAMFPDGEADACNFVLFSASGVHGSYRTLEDDYEAFTHGQERCGGVTFLVVQPRLVAMRYGTVMAESEDDFKWLMHLRRSSHDAVAKIGIE